MSSGAERPVRAGALALGRLARLHNAAITSLGVVVGAWWAAGDPAAARASRTGAVLFAVIAGGALTAFANAFNDWCDVDIDRAAHPERPLPRGDVTPSSALALCGASATIAVAASLAVSLALAVATLAILAAMVAYSLRLKAEGFAGNVCVAVLASLPFVYGAWAVGAAAAALPLFALALPLHVAREIAKDLDDAPADRPYRATLPVALGATTARLVFAGAVAVFLVVLAIVVGRRPVLGLLAAPALLVCLAATRRVVIGRTGGPRLLKAAMVLAMVPFLLVRA